MTQKKKAKILYNQISVSIQRCRHVEHQSTRDGWRVKRHNKITEFFTLPARLMLFYEVYAPDCNIMPSGRFVYRVEWIAQIKQNANWMKLHLHPHYNSITKDVDIHPTSSLNSSEAHSYQTLTDLKTNNISIGNLALPLASKSLN